MPRVKVEDNVELHYEIHGEGIPLIFVNGLTTTLESWNYQIPAFKNNYSVVVYDSRGQGRSDKPATGYSCEHHTRDLKVLIDHLGIKKAHLTGLSFGAFIVLNFAASYPDNTGVIVVSDSTSEAYPLIHQILTGWNEAQNMGGLDLRFEVSLPWLYSENFIKNNPRKIRIFKHAFKKNDINAISRLTMESIENKVTDRLSLITAPALLVVGEEDILTPPRYSWRLKEKIPHAEIMVIEECGHVPPIEKPERFNAVVREFLLKHDHHIRENPGYSVI